jgi:hypothetical protein
MSKDDTTKNRRDVLKTIGTLGTAAVGTASLTGHAAADGDGSSARGQQSNEVEPELSIPGVSKEFTVPAGVICWAAGGMCVLIPTPAGSIAAAGCATAGAGCFIYQGLKYLGWDGCDISVYSLPWFMPQPYIVIPECLPNPIDLLTDVISNFSPWWFPLSGGTGRLSSAVVEEFGTRRTGISTEGEWAVSKEFAEEYDLGPAFDDVPRVAMN